MAEQTRTYLKALFETGKTPTETNFSDLIETFSSVKENANFKIYSKTLVYDQFESCSTQSLFFDLFELDDDFIPVLAFIRLTENFVSAHDGDTQLELYDYNDSNIILRNAFILSANASTASGKMGILDLSHSVYLPIVSPYNVLRGKISITSGVYNLDDLTSGSASIQMLAVKI